MTPSYILESEHIKWHVSSLFCFNLDDYGLQLMEIKNPDILKKMYAPVDHFIKRWDGLGAKGLELNS